MGLKRPEDYVESLSDGRVTYWDGENIADITTHPRFRVPIAITAADYDYDDPELGALRRYKTEDGSEAHRIYQIPRSEDDLDKRIELLHAHLDRHGGLGRLHGADERQGRRSPQVNPQYADNIERMYRYCRDNDLRARRGDHRPQGRPQAPRPRAGRSRPLCAHRRAAATTASWCAAPSCTSPRRRWCTSWW